MTTITKSISLHPEEILWIAGDVNYSRVFFKDQSSMLICKTLKQMERKLYNASSFVRVHRAFLVNIDYLDKIDFVNRELGIGGHKIPIARRRLNQVKECIEVV